MRGLTVLFPMSYIKSAVKKLRAGKSGGVSVITSDCFIHGTDSLYVFIGSRADIRKTQNYREIVLSSIIDKIVDNITSQRNVIKTSDLQFGYKSNCPTIMCSTLVIEIIQYFTQMQSPVYVY